MKKKILFVLSILFGLIFINAGLNKFFYYMPVPDDLPAEVLRVSTAFMEIGWLMPMVAVVEIAGGLLFMIPKTRALGAIVILPVMMGVLMMHLCTAPSGLPIALVLLAINLWVIMENRERYLPMIR